jgi:Fe-S-cluster-containing dehydrogenase component
MSQWNLIIDVARCENCNNCVLANKDEFVGNNFPGYSSPQPLHGESTIKISRTVRGEGHMVDAAYLPTLCNHCDDAPCMRKGGDCISKRADGIVIIDPEKSKGRRDLVAACPYGSIVWNADLNIPQNWIFDAHLLDKGWKEPRCSQSCPTGSMRAVKHSNAEMAAMARAEGLKVLKPELATKPRVYYKNLHRSTHSFIGGSVVAAINGVLECVEGAKVELLQSGSTVHLSATDAFGDFKFDALESQSGKYTVRVHHATLGYAEREVSLGTTQFLGDIELSGARATA